MFVTTGGCVCFWPITAAITEGVLADLACVCLERGQYCLSTICILYLCIICIHTEVVTVYICVMCLTFMLQWEQVNRLNVTNLCLVQKLLEKT